jgi:hypothetical protein
MRPILELKDERSFVEKFKVPWIFDTILGKAWLIFTSVFTLYIGFRFAYSVLSGGKG